MKKRILSLLLAALMVLCVIPAISLVSYAATPDTVEDYMTALGVSEGGTDDSYGIEVAKLAGLPQKVISRAKEELRELEVMGRQKLSETLEKTAEHQFSFNAINEQNAIAKLRAADINTMSPMDALMFIKDIKDTL